MTEIVVIRLCDDDSDTNRKISIIDYKPHIQCDSYTRKFSIDIIGNPSNFYKALAGGYDAHILDKFLSFSNGYLNIMTPILIDLINWLPLEKTKNISLFEWGNVVFEKEVNIAIKCSKFCFTNNTCKQNATFTLYNNANSINFTKSSFCGDFSFKTIQPQENVTKDMICCDCIFGSENQNGKIDFSNFQFDGLVDFSNTTFGLEINFENVSFDKKANFSNTKFSHKAIFAKTSFKDEVNFNNAVFCDSADFNGATFDKDIYFHRAIFKQDLQIYRAIFERVVNFYFATFENIVNFSACVIKNPRFLNFVGIDTKNISQEKMKQYISQKAKDESEIKENIERNRTEINLALQHAQNLKDSFRVIKDTLLTQNNLLEAQNWHKLELYANELELEYKLEQGQNKKSNQKELPKYDKRDYQKFNWRKLLVPIGYCGSIIEGLPFFMLIRMPYMLWNFAIWCAGKILNLLKFVRIAIKSINPLECEKIKVFWKYYYRVRSKAYRIKLNKQKNNALDFTLWIDTVILKLYRHTSNHHTNFTTILNFTIGMIVVYGLFLLLINSVLPYMANYNGELVSFSIIIALGVFFLITFIPYIIGKNIFCDKLALLLLFFIVIVWVLSNTFLSLFMHTLCYLMIYLVCLGLFYLIFNIRIIADYIRVAIYIIFLIILTINPQLINPFINVFKTDSITDSRLETQMLTINNQDMQILANLALKQLSTNNKDIENPKDIIQNNKDILFKLYKKIISNQQEKYEKILNILETKDLSQENTIKSLHNLRTKSDKIFNKNGAVDTISNIISENFLGYTNSNYKSAHYIVEHKTEAIYILKVITNNNIQNVLKAIYIDETKNDILKSTNIIYSIILLLCIFSLQKNCTEKFNNTKLKGIQ